MPYESEAGAHHRLGGRLSYLSVLPEPVPQIIDGDTINRPHGYAVGDNGVTDQLSRSSRTRIAGDMAERRCCRNLFCKS
jgi:hypothetical protein